MKMHANRQRRDPFVAYLEDPLAPREASLDPSLLAACLGPSASTSEVGSLRSRFRQAGRGLKRGAKLAARVEPTRLSLQATKRVGKYGARLAAAATGPLRRRIFNKLFGTLTKRRAALLAHQRSGSSTPTRTDLAQARRWTVDYLRHKGPFGRFVAASLGGSYVGEPATATLVAASVPVLLQLAKKLIRSGEREGAPSDPRSVGARRDGGTLTEPTSDAHLTPGDDE